MANKLYNLALMTTSTTGTGTITLGAAVAPFLTFAQAGISNGDVISYSIIDSAGGNSEIGTGTYTSSGTTLSRTVTKSTNSNSAISLSGSAQVMITPQASDLSAPPGALVSKNTYISSQTITIPSTQCTIRLVGGGGGAKDTSAEAAAAGGGAYLEKYLTGLTVGNTLALTIGAAGAATPTSGGNSTLASGTQTITTLTAAGGSSASGGTSGAGGAATNGDLNVSGGDGVQTFYSICGSPVVNYAQGGTTPLAMSVAISGGPASLAGSGYGGGAAAVSTGSTISAAGAAGVCIIEWYA